MTTALQTSCVSHTATGDPTYFPYQTGDFWPVYIPPVYPQPVVYVYPPTPIFYPLVSDPLLTEQIEGLKDEIKKLRKEIKRARG